ncbi:MAG: FAD:protein FMN transferase [Rhodothermales bacterium]
MAPLYGQSLERYRFSHPQMGTQFNIVLYAPDSVLAHRAASAAFSRIDTLNQHLSDYLSNSELSRLSATSGSGLDVPVSDDLWTVLSSAQQLAQETGGAFDVTVGPLTRLWRWARRRNQRPPEADLEQARRTVGYRHLVLDSMAQTVRLAVPGMRLDVGGIAKGFAVDEALTVLQSFGLVCALVDGGGDIRVGEPPPGEGGWRIELSTVDAAGHLVQEERVLARSAIATSGDTYRFLEVDGTRFSHILDPRTGMGLKHGSLVTVIAPTGIQADALASAVSVLGYGEGTVLVARYPKVAFRVIHRDQDRHRRFQSRSFDSLAVSF